MTFNAKLSATDGLDHLAGRLDRIIAAKFPTDLGGHPWTVVLNQLDQIAGKPARTFNTTDLQSQLKMLTRGLGNLGFPFDDNRRTIGALGRELTIVRNARARGDAFTRLAARRAHDFCVRLLEYSGEASRRSRSMRGYLGTTRTEWLASAYPGRSDPGPLASLLVAAAGAHCGS